MDAARRLEGRVALVTGASSGPGKPPRATLDRRARSGQFYCCGNLFADVGVPGYTWSLRAGQLSVGFLVSLSSDNPAAATVPPSATVPAGSASTTFAVTTNNVTNARSAIILGTAGGITRHAVITVWEPFHFSNDFFPVGTVVRLEARPAADSELPRLAAESPGLRRRLEDHDRARHDDHLPAAFVLR